MSGKRGAKPLVLCGPSGVGKSSLLKLLLQDFPDSFGFSVSHTTRRPRPGERHGVEYYFTDRPEMQAAIERGEFIETAVYSGNMYGTSKRAVYDVQEAGKVTILDIDVEGVRQVKRTDLDPVLVFIRPPSLEELETRLVQRRTETPESLQQRLAIAKAEMEYGNAPGNFHLVIVNDDLEKAYAILKAFLVEKFCLC